MVSVVEIYHQTLVMLVNILPRMPQFYGGIYRRLTAEN